MKKNKNSNYWLAKQKKDPFYRLSKAQGYRSRSAFKLIEMNKKFKFIKKKSLLLDLGSCPGGWSQIANKEIVRGRILAVDIKPMEKINNVDFDGGSGGYYNQYFFTSMFSIHNSKNINIDIIELLTKGYSSR